MVNIEQMQESALGEMLEAARYFDQTIKKYKDHPNRHSCYSLEWDYCHYARRDLEAKVFQYAEIVLYTNTGSYVALQ